MIRLLRLITRVEVVAKESNHQDYAQDQLSSIPQYTCITTDWDLMLSMVLFCFGNITLLAILYQFSDNNIVSKRTQRVQFSAMALKAAHKPHIAQFCEIKIIGSLYHCRAIPESFCTIHPIIC